MKVPTERLREMLAACEGVTPGPWANSSSVVASETALHDVVYGPDDTVPDRRGVAYCGDEMRHRMGLPYGAERDANANHIANCDPDTIRSALSELLELREAVKAQTEALTFYRDEFKPKIGKPIPGASSITFHPSEALLDDCGNRAMTVLARSLQSHTGEA